MGRLNGEYQLWNNFEKKPCPMAVTDRRENVIRLVVFTGFFYCISNDV